jgi:SAM-dependent methyltransferase
VQRRTNPWLLASIDIGEKRYPGLRLSWQYLSLRFPFEDECFQTVLLHQVIAHLEPEVARNVLSEALRVMRKGGRIFIFSPTRFDKAARRDNTLMCPYSPSEMRALITSAGFQNVVHLDRPRELLGNNPLARVAMRTAFRLTRWDRLSATANCQASKP